MLLRFGFAVLAVGLVVTAYGLVVAWPPSQHRASIFMIIGNMIMVLGQILIGLGRWSQRRIQRSSASGTGEMSAAKYSNLGDST
jgi:hypothetical protein